MTTNDRSESLQVSVSIVFQALSTVFHELTEGASLQVCWVLNRGDAGLLRSLDRLSSAQASAPPAQGGAPIAAHVDHLCYGLSLLNRWADGEENPFAQADYGASWRRTEVSEEQWRQLRERLRNESERWTGRLSEPYPLNEVEMTGLVASAAHLAYHLGAIRQIDRSTAGPPED